MKKILMSALALGAISSSLHAYTGCYKQACKSVKVTVLYPTTSGKIYVGTSGNEGNLPSCTAIKAGYGSPYTYIPANANMFI